MFLDLNEENVIDASEIVKGNLIGRGAFGFVFKATMNRKSSTDGPQSVAMKMLQPVQPGIRTGKVKPKYLKKSGQLQLIIISFHSFSECTNGIQSGFGKMAP